MKAEKKWIAIGTTVAGVLLGSHQAWADDFADGDKDAAYNAISATLAVPSTYVAPDCGCELLHDLTAMLEWDWNWHVGVGVRTYRGWLGSLTKRVYWEQKFSGVDQLNTTLTDPGTGTRDFALVYDDGQDKWHYWYAGSDIAQSNTTTLTTTETVWAGIIGRPNSSNMSSDTARWNQFGWATFAEWSWHGGWPYYTYIYDVGGDHVRANPAPDNGYTDVWTE